MRSARRGGRWFKRGLLICLHLIAQRTPSRRDSKGLPSGRTRLWPTRVQCHGREDARCIDVRIERGASGPAVSSGQERLRHRLVDTSRTGQRPRRTRAQVHVRRSCALAGPALDDAVRLTGCEHGTQSVDVQLREVNGAAGSGQARATVHRSLGEGGGQPAAAPGENRTAGVAVRVGAFRHPASAARRGKSIAHRLPTSSSRRGHRQSRAGGAVFRA